VEAAQAAVRCNPDWRRQFLHMAMRRERRIAKVALARKLAVACIGCGARDGIIKKP
jgi:transposase